MKEELAWFICPMHPEIRQRGPGDCSICGMALESEEPSLGDDDSELRSMTRRLWVSALLTAPLVAASMARGAGIIQTALATPVVLWGGGPFFKRAWDSVRARRANMYTLIGLGTGTAYGVSVVSVFSRGASPLYFESAAMITALVLVGEVLQLRARGRTMGAIRALMELAPTVGHRLNADGSETDVSVDELNAGDRLRVKPGEKVPSDGRIEEGASWINESMVNGEPFPVEKLPGQSVIGATINGHGSFVMRAEYVGRETLLARIVRTVSEAQRNLPPIQQLADRISAIFVPAVIVISMATFALWIALGPEPRFGTALVNAIAVLVIACPCALGLATPMSVVVGLGQAARAGILIKKTDALERLERADTLVIDKTGTLTEGKPKLMSIAPVAPWDEKTILSVARALERGSEHPLAAAFARGDAAKETAPRVEKFSALPGEGVTGVIDGKSAALGNLKLMARMGADANADARAASERLERGETPLLLAIDGKFAGAFGVSDTVKDTAAAAIRDLECFGLRIVMLTGDNRKTAEAVARAVGITEIEADVPPLEKAGVVRRLMQEGRTIVMAGDGINDAAALAVADVGIAMGTGSDAAIEGAAVTLVKGDLRGIARTLRLSRAVMKNIRQNLFFAFVYNAAGITIAAGALYPLFGILLNPMVAAAAMSLSSASVIGNALRLKKVDLLGRDGGAHERI